MVSSFIARKMAILHHPNLSQALTAFTNISELKQIHAHIIISGLTTHIFTITRLLAFTAISNSGDLNYAKTLFKHIENPTLFMYNTMIRGFSQTIEPLNSVNYYIRLLRNKISPDIFTFPFLIRSCSISSFLSLGKEIHTHVIQFGLDSDIFIINNTINFYSSCRELKDAKQLFDEYHSVIDVVSWTSMITGYSNSGEIEMAYEIFKRMPCRNIVSWNAMISGYAQSGKINEARKVFDEMPERNAASWSTIVTGYSQCRMCKEALELFREMVRSGLVPNESALVSAVSASAQIRVLEEGEWLHNYVKEEKIEVNVNLGTALLDMYGKCGNIEKALRVFNGMPIKNVFSWNSMIAGLALNGYGQQALSLFLKMQMVGPAPNGITFIGVLSGCSHAGLVHEGRWIFDLMIQNYHIKPQLEHYGCMVDLLGRAGLIKEALDFVDGMLVEPHPGLWGALVGACRIHGDVKLGEELGKRLIDLEPHHSGRYILVSNIFAAAKRWDDVAMVRDLLKNRRVFKTVGNSIVETQSCDPQVLAS